MKTNFRKINEKILQFKYWKIKLILKEVVLQRKIMSMENRKLCDIKQMFIFKTVPRKAGEKSIKSLSVYFPVENAIKDSFK